MFALQLRYEDGFWPNLLTLSYILLAYTLGLYWIIFAPIWFMLPGILLLGHAMVIAAYMIHECAHNTIFSNKQANARLGRFLSWFNGACYEDFEDIRHKHNRHHTDRADVIAYDYRVYLRDHPTLLRLIQTLEWLYIPAVELMMHTMVVVLPFIDTHRHHKLRRVTFYLLLRGALFAALAVLSPLALFGYMLAYFLFLHMIHFMDVHQHTYDVLTTLDQKRGEEVKQFDRNFELHNTYSNPVSLKHTWMNVLFLNFGFHNAHHERPTLPWYRLPRFHHQRFDDPNTQVLPFANLVRSYHRFRVQRVLNEDPVGMDVLGDGGKNFIGVTGVSFLTAH